MHLYCKESRLIQKVAFFLLIVNVYTDVAPGDEYSEEALNTKCDSRAASRDAGKAEDQGAIGQGN